MHNDFILIVSWVGGDIYNVLDYLLISCPCVKQAKPI